MKDRIAAQLLKWVSVLCIWGGSALVIWGTLQPWVNVLLFKTIPLSFPGVLFTFGMWCFGLAALILLGARRSALLCLIAAAFLLHWLALARIDAPHRIKHDVIGAQLSLFPINRLLDQVHLPNITVSDWSIPNPRLLGPGIDLTQRGALWLLAGGVIGLPVDPALTWTLRRLRFAQCAQCRARWPAARRACFCPQCGSPTPLYSPLLCPVCHTKARSSDQYCIACGNSMPER